MLVPLLALLIYPGGPVRAADAIYRCTAADGRIEFRQSPCQGPDSGGRIELGPDNSGWEPPPEVERPSREARPRRSADPGRRAREERRQQERCWEKRRRLDEVKRRLRTGYRPGQGEGLRRRRGDYADYIRRFCR